MYILRSLGGTMETTLILRTLLFLISVVCCQAISWTFFTRNSTFDGNNCETKDVVFEETIYKTISGCAMHCGRSNVCRSVFYDHTSFRCIGCKVYHNISETEEIDGSLYYKKHVCPDGTEIQRGRSCYFASPTTFLIFNNAVAYCEARNARLVEVETEAENRLLKTYLSSKQFIGVWLGITDSRAEGMWEFYSSDEPATFTSWANYEPNDIGFEDCGAYISTLDWYMADVSCLGVIPLNAFCEYTIDA